MSFGGGGGKAWPFLTPTGSQPLLLPVGVTQDRSLLQACTLLRKGGGRGAVDGPSLMARSRDSCNCMAYLYWCGSAHAVPGHNITHWVPAGNQRAGVGAGLIGAEHEPPPELSHSKRRRLLLGDPCAVRCWLIWGRATIWHTLLALRVAQSGSIGWLLPRTCPVPCAQLCYGGGLQQHS